MVLLCIIMVPYGYIFFFCCQALNSVDCSSIANAGDKSRDKWWEEKQASHQEEQELSQQSTLYWSSPIMFQV